MLLKNIIPSQNVSSFFLGRGENLDGVLAENFAGHQVIRMIQTHSDKVVFIDEDFLEKNPEKVLFVDDIDGLVTKQKKVVLVVRVADCTPIFLYHPSGVVGVVHAGRVGTQKQILRKSLEELRAKYGLQEDLTIWLGPRICHQCYQIDWGKEPNYDLLGENMSQIKAVLDPDKNKIIVSEFCTAHDNDRFYSLRKDGQGVEMNFGLVALG